MTKMIVIGAGVMGASVAYRLAQAGADVTVLEATRIGGGTSGSSFAWTNAHKKPPKPYHDLNVGGMKAHAALKDEFGATPWWHGGGSLEWELEPDRADQRANVEQLRAWGYAAEWIDLKQVEELEPDINPAVIGDAPVAYFPEEGWLDPVVYAHAMLSTGQRHHGTKIVCGAKVVDLLMTGDRVSGVRLADDTRYEADMVVNCAGRWTNEAVCEAGAASTARADGWLPGFRAAGGRRLEPGSPHHRDRRAAGRRGALDAALESDRRALNLR